MLREPLAIEDISGSNGERILRLTGPIIISNLFEFQSLVRGNSNPRLILDFAGVPYMDSAGIGALVGAHVSHSKDGRSLALAGVCERVLNALKVTRVDGFFKFYNNVTAAENAA
ncbi:MAG TPA: STAS domain-containing protein [Acidobacteriaceae bacterium]